MNQGDLVAPSLAPRSDGFRRAPDTAMVGHGGVHNVVTGAARHVTGDAVVILVLLQANRLRQTTPAVRVALQTAVSVERNAFLWGRQLMRIVARNASQLALARGE